MITVPDPLSAALMTSAGCLRAWPSFVVRLSVMLCLHSSVYQGKH